MVLRDLDDWKWFISHAEFSFNGTGQQGSMVEVKMKGRQRLRFPTTEGKSMIVRELLDTMSRHLTRGVTGVDEVECCVNLIAGLPTGDNKWRFQKQHSLVTEKYMEAKSFDDKDAESLSAYESFTMMFKSTIEGIFNLAVASVRV